MMSSFAKPLEYGVKYGGSTWRKQAGRLYNVSGNPKEETMPTVALKGKELLKAVEKLNPDELKTFIQDVLYLRARKAAPSLSAKETELYQQIYKGLPEEMVKRYSALIKKRKKLSLTKAEHQELLTLSGKAENQDVERLTALIELAQLRKISVEVLMDQLGLKAPPVDG
jgi:hypothetical protein